MQNQAKKNIRAMTNLKNIISKKYYDFLNIFLKKNLKCNLFILKI